MTTLEEEIAQAIEKSGAFTELEKYGHVNYSVAADATIAVIEARLLSEKTIHAVNVAYCKHWNESENEEPVIISAIKAVWEHIKQGAV